MVKDSRAYKLVDGYPPTADNYDKVIASLKGRFGREDLQIEVYVRELLQLVLQNAIKKSQNEPVEPLSSLYDKLESHLRALDSFGVTTDKCAAMLLPLVESSLPEELLRAWQRSTVGTTQNDDLTPDLLSKDRLTRLIKFLDGEVQNEMRISMAVKGFDLGLSEKVSVPSGRNRKNSYSNNVPSAIGLLAAESKGHLCIFCDSKDHKSANCPEARNMSYSDKQECAKRRRACFNCLYTGHGCRDCRVNVKCEKCSRRHVTLMCRDNQGGSVTPQTKNNEIHKEASLASLSGRTSVFLQVLLVRLRGQTGEKCVRALIDSGSQRSYLSKAAAAEMGYESTGEQKMCHLLFGGDSTNTVNHKKYLVRVGSICSDFTCNFEVLDQDTICGKIPTIPRGEWHDELKMMNIKLTDYCDSDESIELLIGADVAGKLLTNRRVQLKCGLVAFETLLGWTVMGSIPEKKKEDAVLSAISLHVASCDVQDLWTLDTLGIKDPLARKSKKEQQQKMYNEFLKGVKVNEEGRYEVRLPWLEAHPPLTDNKSISERRLSSLVKKLTADKLYEAYDAVFEEWRDEGIIEYVPNDAVAATGHFLPHRHIVKENSTTAIRPVFDASAKQPPHPALNDCLQTGPNFIELITDILLRFRAGSIGVIADIRKAFLQISLDPKERDFLRFFWLNKFGHNVMLRHCRVVFGVCSSPFILAAVIKLHLEKILKNLKNDLPIDFTERNIVKLLDSFYVDNCVTSVNSTDQLDSFMSEAKRAMESAKFDLRGWEYSNDFSGNARVGVLGIMWDKQRDVLCLNATVFENMSVDRVTKRIMLSSAHRLFDPLGFVCPVALTPRLLLQETWSKNLWWDDEVDDSTSKRFQKWVSELQLLDRIQVPRCIIGDIENRKISLHTFCDASQSAYAAVTFIRVEEESGVRVRFVQAKARVAPIRGENESKHSIPRLELLAALVGVRLTVSITEAMELNNVEIRYWSDSSTALAWIRRDINWGTFVFNRVREIRAFSKVEQWKHVPGHLNPADLPSRGCTVSQLIESQWWEGPEWLRDTRNWPTPNFTCDEKEVNQEKRKTAIKGSASQAVFLLCLLNGSEMEVPWYSNRYSSYAKLRRVIAWLNRFRFNCKNSHNRRTGRRLSASEIYEAESDLVRLIQSQSFTSLDDKRIKHLNPFHDELGVIRLKTKITLRDDNFNFRCPIILPSNHDVVNLIIRDKHVHANHAGVQITLSNLREKFWVLGGRRTVRCVIRKCIDCRRHDSQPLEMAPPPLPLYRVREAAVFEIIGVDFTGPVYLKGGEKAWICIFTCAVYRAVHFELVSSLDVPKFLLALRRHISRGGRPSVIFSDNGTNFVGLNNELKKLDFTKLDGSADLQEIEWKFNPPSAPWWGGFWERLIGILKKLLRRSLKKSCLGSEEICTVLLDCEAVINSRPITFLSDNDNEIAPLTPSHFLREIREIGVLDLDYIEKCCLRKRFAHRQIINEDLRQRFRNEYLGALSYQRKNYNARDVNIGDIVLIGNDNTKRIEWPLAKIKDVYKGRDGNIRVVRLITATGELTRPIQRIYPLELNCEFDKEGLATMCEKRVITRRGRVVRQPQRFVPA